jgi:iron complex transport system substrate-binding protein
LAENIVGISHECDHPPDILDRPRVSSTRVDASATSATIDAQVRGLIRGALSVYDVDEKLLGELAPDLILTQDHCRVCAVSLEDVEVACRRLTGKDAHVVSTMPESLEAIREDFRRIARAAGIEARGERLVADFDAALAEVARRVEGAARPKVALLEWIEPPMIAGGWMPELARIAGGDPVIVTAPGRFETVDFGRIEAADPDVVVVLPCGFDLERTMRELDSMGFASQLRELRATREGHTFAVDGNALFNRPGPRIAESAEVLAAALHPDRFEARGRLSRWPAPDIGH